MDAASTAFSKILNRGSKDGSSGQETSRRGPSDTKAQEQSKHHDHHHHHNHHHQPGDKQPPKTPPSKEEVSPSGAMAPTTTTTQEQTTAAPVEHETIQRHHEQREQKVVDKERHQDHFKTTVQPLREREVRPEQHTHEQAELRREEREHAGRDVRGMQERQFRDTKREGDATSEVVTEPTLTSEHVHHHLHETVQPVIEKETVIPSVTHKTIPVKEVHQDPAVDEGITTNKPISKEEFEARLKGK